ncbi:MAG: hypothetical protein IKP71_05245, partial [Candidatus Riflebacteria bacterium]|nr:hypothetical protein [Candidatus Riflebacteria bacterium]
LPATTNNNDYNKLCNLFQNDKKCSIKNYIFVIISLFDGLSVFDLQNLLFQNQSFVFHLLIFACNYFRMNVAR